MIKEKIFKNLICLDCHKQLNLSSKKLTCSNCGKIYQIIENKLYFLDKKIEILNQESSDAIVNKLKILFKKYPIIFSFLYYAFGASFVGKSAKKAIENIESDKLIINLGSGIKKINDNVVNIDFYPFDNVDIVSDISDLPFNNNSVDVVINEFVLEHVKNPKKIVKEIYRVLKPNGELFLWDLIIPERKMVEKEIYVILLKIKIDQKIVDSGYGTKWEKEQDAYSFLKLGKDVGFEVLEQKIEEDMFFIKYKKV